MKLGAEPKKVVILVALVALAAYIFLSNSGSTPPRQQQTAPVASPEPVTATPPGATPPGATPPNPRTRVSNAGRRVSQTFRPTLRPYAADERPDPTEVDPTLRLDVLAKLQELEVDGVERSLFDFSAPPAPERPEPKIIPKPVVEPDPEPPEPIERPKPPPPPIPLRFYGYISPASSTDRRAFFIEGEEIHVANEGDLISDRYKVDRIGVSSAEVTDTEHDNQQTLQLVPEMR